MNENLCIAIITTASIFAGFLVAFLSSYLTARNKRYENEMALITKAVQIGLDEMYKQEKGQKTGQ